VLTGADIREGDIIIGLASSGVHSNGFSLVRRIIADRGWSIGETYPSTGGVSLGEQLLEPTRIYVRALLPLVQERLIKGLAHITGGGLLENIPRVLPADAHARVDAGAWQLPGLFQLLQEGGNVEPQEMVRTFNCGIGMVAVVSADQADQVASRLEAAGETVFRIGRIEAGPRGCTVSGTDGAWTATHNA
jgi:phosphoribosylformylglycinamidine cyclo-ligase